MSERTTDELIEALEKWRKEAVDVRQWAVISAHSPASTLVAKANDGDVTSCRHDTAREALAKLCEELGI